MSTTAFNASKVRGGGELYDASASPAATPPPGKAHRPAKPFDSLVAWLTAPVAFVLGLYAMALPMLVGALLGGAGTLRAFAKQKAAWNAMRHLGHKALDAGLVPDFLIRLAIRKFCAQKAAELEADAPGVEAAMVRARARARGRRAARTLRRPGALLPLHAKPRHAHTVALAQARTMAFADELRRMPIAVHTQAANEQHYEVTAAFYDICLGAARASSRCVALCAHGGKALDCDHVWGVGPPIHGEP